MRTKNPGQAGAPPRGGGAPNYPSSSLISAILFARAAHSTQSRYHHSARGTIVHEDRPQSLLECFESYSIRLSFPLISSKLKQIPVEITRKCFLISHQLKGRMAVEITVCVLCMPFSMFGGKYWDPLPQHASCVFLQPPPRLFVTTPSGSEFSKLCGFHCPQLNQ